MKKRGFTLIELIVVMAIIAILILLATPKYLNYTKDAYLTRVKVTIKELESANMQYYIKHDEWARSSDEPYTSEEIVEYSNKVFDKTGKIIQLDEDGNYYDIDYAKLDNYVTGVEDKELYLLQNPVGCVYRVDDLTEEGKKHFESKKEGPKEPENPIPPIVDGQLPSTLESFEASSYTNWGGSGTISHTYHPWNAFDGKYDILCNGWMSSQQANAWLRMNFTNKEEINMVKMVNSSNVYALGEYRCKDFRIEYLDETDGQWKVALTDRMENRTGWQEFEFDSVGAHKSWRLWIVNHGCGSSAYLAIGEIELLKK